MAPTFVVSLDFELYWGVRDSQPMSTYAANLLGARDAVPRLVDAFERAGVHATWATVGALMFDAGDALRAVMPDPPSYVDRRVSPYPEFQRLTTEAEAPMQLARSVVQRVVDGPHQELATHTFSHFYCLEPGQDAEMFRADLRAARQAAATFGRTPRSLVFPRNQVALAYLDVLRDEGIVAYRGNERAWMYAGSGRAGNTLPKRAARWADAHVNVAGPHVAWPEVERGLVNVPASRFLRPVGGRFGVRRRLRRRRTLDAMTAAAAAGGVFHLWFHPHNFGVDTDDNLAELAVVLDHFRRLADTYGMRSRSMAELADELLGAGEA